MEELYRLYFKPFPRISTDRLLLRLPERGDVNDMFELCRDERVSHYSDWSPHRTPADSRDYIAFLLKKYRKNSCFTFGITLRESGRLIGTASIVEINYNYKIAQIGYSLNTAYHHMGYATEAVRALCGFCFQKLGTERLEAKVMCENLPSERLLLRLGFKKEAMLKKGAVCKGKTVDVNLFSLTV